MMGLYLAVITVALVISALVIETDWKMNGK